MNDISAVTQKLPDGRGRILVVIPTLNEVRHIAEVIDVLSADLPRDYAIEFVISDGGSTDGTVQVVEQLARKMADLHIIANPQRLQSAGVNRAVAVFGQNADYLIRCDAHAVYPRGYISQLITTLRATGADSVVVPMDTLATTGTQAAVAWVSNSGVGTGGSGHRSGRVSGLVDHGHHAAFKMQAFRAVGGYDPTYSHNEDAEFDCRLRHVGGRIFLDADIRIGYYPRKTLKLLAHQYFNYGKGRSRTIRRHPQSMRLRQIAVPAHAALLCLSLVLGGAFNSAFLLYPLFYVGAITVVGIHIAVRERSVIGLRTAPAAIVMHLAWAAGFYWGFLTVHELLWAKRGKLATTLVEGTDSVDI